MFKELNGSFVIDEKAPKGFSTSRRIIVEAVQGGITMTVQDDQGLLIDIRLDKEGYKDLIDALWFKLRHSEKIGKLESKIEEEEKAEQVRRDEEGREAQDHEPQQYDDVEY